MRCSTGLGATVGKSREAQGSTSGTIARHPMHHLGGFFAEPRPFLPATIVTTDAGTGLVHMAPDHGEDDFLVCKAAGHRSGLRGRRRRQYRDDWVWLGGQGSVINPKFNAPDGPICSDLREAGALLRRRRTSPFLSAQLAVQGEGHLPLHAAMVHPDGPRFDARSIAPAAGGRPGESRCSRDGCVRLALDRRGPAGCRESKNRIRAMVEGRPDWVLSRQRAWGVPIALYVHRKTGDYLEDPAVNSRIIRAFHEGRRRRLVPGRPPACSATAIARGLRAGHGHPRRLVRQRLDPRLRHRGALRPGRPRRPLSARARTSIAAGSSRACSKAAAPAAGRRSRRC